MMRDAALIAVIGMTSVVSGCGDKPQTSGGSRSDIAAFQGVENRYAAAGWKPGDRVSWEQSLKARAQNTQNEYTKTSTTK